MNKETGYIRRQIAFLMIIVLILPLCLVVRVEGTESASENPFDAARIRYMIEANLTTENTDEEFYRLLTAFLHRLLCRLYLMK